MSFIITVIFIINSTFLIYCKYIQFLLIIRKQKESSSHYYFFFWRNKHTQEREMSFNIKAHHNSIQKLRF